MEDTMTKYGAPYHFASECMGNYGDRKCKCKAGFIGDHTPYCKPKPCKDNSDAHCDEGGECKGTYMEWTCVCKAPHFMQNPVNPKSCIHAPCKVESCGRGFINGYHMNFADTCEGTFKEPSCNCKKQFTGTSTNQCEVGYCTKSTDAVECCGKGATSCDGPLTKPICYCDESRHFVPSKDGSSCVLAHCSSDPETKKCGDGNKCSGTMKSWQCVCSAAGWKVDPEDHKKCVEIDCTSEMATMACGNGAIGCEGSMNQPICECDVKNDYVTGKDGRCEMSHCSASSDVLEMCGSGNGCHGTLSSYQCVCNGKGWTDHPTDPKQCVEVMCIDVSDITAVCGSGAVRCTGSTRSPLCICNNDENYITSDDGLSCVAASCENNLEAQEKCGKGNKCSGTYKHYACICSAYGYEADSSDVTLCKRRQCDNSMAAEICGDGATECSGSVLNPICACDMEGYMQAGDLHSCQPMPCRFNKNLDCGKGNACSGTYFSASCVCNGPAYMVDPDNSQACKEAKCDYKECGKIMHGHIPHYYADGCYGTYTDRQCKCKEGYTGTDTDYCKPETCNTNPKATCGGVTSRCKGTFDKWSCVCDAPEYMLDPMDNLNCIKAPCDIEQCGFGYIHDVKQNFALSCSGFYSDPKCECRPHGFILGDEWECIIDPSCRNSPKGRLCNECGDCNGDYFHFECMCKAPEFKRAKNDPQTCEEAPCQLSQCGETKDYRDNSFYHATKCYGTYAKPSCNCKQGYHVDANTGKCVPADCSSIANVCDGKGMCRGTTVDYTCECDMHYEHPDDNLKSCKPASCTTHDDVCAGDGTCYGTFFVFDCRCYPGFEQKRYGIGLATCVRATCTNDQCGGTPISPHGKCGGGYFDNYNCTCNQGFTHPRLPNKQPILSKCDYECDVSHCGLLGTKECVGTINAFHCVCKDGFMHPRDGLDQHVNTYCEVKCDDSQCGGDTQQPFGKCTGTKKEFTCQCYPGNSHPLDKQLEIIHTKCRESCSHDQCGVHDEDSHGKCSGSKLAYSCKCEPGFDHPTDYTGDKLYTMCKDTNECEEDKNICDPNAKCVNTPGSYKCECNEPYVGEGSRMGKCYLNGGWGPWKHKECSQTCGGGSTMKSRPCLVPTPYLTNDTCQGDPTEEDLRCNHFPCKDLCILEKCECSSVRQFVNGAAPNENLEFFKDIKGFKFHHATAMLTKFGRMATQDLCKVDKTFGSMEEIKKQLDDDMGSVRNALKEYSKAKREMRVYINCNENPDIRETLFKTYKKIATHMFMTKFVLSDLEVERKTIYKRMALCNSDDNYSFGDMMSMLGNRDPNGSP